MATVWNRPCPIRCLRQWLPPILRLALLGVVLGSGARLHAQNRREYQIKAVLVLNLARFVEWPAAAFDSTNAPLVIGVLGHDPFGPVLDEVIRNERVHNRPVVIKRYKSVNEIKHCHLLFVSAHEQPRLPERLSALRNRPILTVSDVEHFTRHGGIIRLFTKPDGKTGLRINAGAARAANLTISSKLWQVAEIVNQEDD